MIAAFLDHFILEPTRQLTERELLTFRWYKNTKQESSTASWGREGREYFEKFLCSHLVEKVKSIWLNFIPIETIKYCFKKT